MKQTEAEIKKAWPNARSFPRGPIKVGEMSNGLREVVAKATGRLANAYSSDFGREVVRCYGTEIASLVRRGKALDAAQLEVGLSQPTNGLVWEMQATDGRISTKRWEDSGLSEREIDLRDQRLPLRELIEDPAYFLMRVMFELDILNSGELTRTTHYMPASRSGILLGHKTLAGLIVGQASRAWVDPIEIPRLPGVITDLVQAILLLERIRPPSDELEKVISFLEGDVTRGIVDMEQVAEYPEVFYKNEHGKFLLHQVSSMVSEVAPIVLYLKYLVRPGHLFIIEEPESHIDAENQRKLARAIAMLINANVKVLITTHSDYFVNQLNNLLLLSRVKSQSRSARRYRSSEVLEPSCVAAYLFDPSDNGSRMSKLEVTAEEGIPTFPFTDSHSALYNEAIALEHAPS
ncbi:MAG: AAA family ATPase [Chloroflexi bacterium]|nr:AAA family ATPase [Chloroflexota bacterium]MCY3939087.1 AAA family ATPase [Chloroflexota bacterium]